MKQSNLPETARKAFYHGWYAAGEEINESEDYDDFMKFEDPCTEDE